MSKAGACAGVSEGTCACACAGAGASAGPGVGAGAGAGAPFSVRYSTKNRGGCGWIS